MMETASVFNFEDFEPRPAKKKKQIGTDKQWQVSELLRDLTKNGRFGLVSDLAAALNREVSTICGWKSGAERHLPPKHEADNIIAKLEELMDIGFFDAKFDRIAFRNGQLNSPKKEEEFAPMTYTVSGNRIVEDVKGTPVDPITETIFKLNDRRSEISDKVISLNQQLEDIRNTLADLEDEDKDLEVTVTTLRKYTAKKAG